VKDYETILNNLLMVCSHSGRYGRGIYHIMIENRNFMRELLKSPGTRSRFIWFEDIICDHELFLQSLLSALRPTFPAVGVNEIFGLPLRSRWPGRNYGPEEIMWTEEWASLREILGYRPVQDQLTDPLNMESCYARAMKVCMEVPFRLNENRRLLETLLIYPDALEGYTQSWLEKADFFFMNVWQAAECDAFYQEKYPNRQQPKIRDWPGDESEHIQYWQESKPRQSVEVQEHIQVDKQEETPSPREPEAR